MVKDIKKYSFFIIAILIFLAGIAHAAISFTLNNSIKNRVSITPSLHELVLKPGMYTIFYEYFKTTEKLGPIEFGRFNRITDLEERLTLSIVSLKDNKPLTLMQDDSKTYSSYKNFGESLYSFRIAEQGSYLIETKFAAAESDESPLKLTLVANFFESFLRIAKIVAVYFAIACCFAAVGLVVVIRTR